MVTAGMAVLRNIACIILLQKHKLASHRAKTGIITEHWDDLLRLAGSLKLGLVQVGGLMRTLQTNERPTRLARALEELGRIVKTLYLLA
jgi:TnpA family transposase